MNKKEQAKEAADAAVLAWMQGHPGHWWRVAEAAEGAGIPITAANTALRRLWSRGDVERDEAEKRRRSRNGAVYGRYPVYQVRAVSFDPGHFPGWMLPTEIIIPAGAIRGIRVIKPK